ncbi:DUF3616 domain-containing protein [Pigmentiphaga aceris]|uniref:DUF3616 domain-containing protein n=1 Tax=Pigmentiphaga aceris TaxID=1940612 RepID=A0A5C0AZU5_9BURK|nr:DUF3616 domain-containing protein [Pigmentiphaga aceris]QEI07992.1 DUF3616 domain-containing protein [Pigmentiphaga aceris]
MAILDLSSAQAKISSLYVTLFGRAPDSSGLQFWSRAADSMSMADIAASLLASPEGVATVPGGNAAFISSLYTSALGRAPTAAELAAATQTLSQGGDIGAARASLASALIQTLATPAPTTKPATMTDAEYAQALADRDTLANKADAGVYFAQSVAGNNMSLAGRVLDAVNATPASLQAARTQADQGTATQVAELYAALLDRAPDTAGLAWWTAQLNNGVPMSNIIASMLGSAEGTALYGSAATSQAFLQTFYQSVLGRAPDAAGMAFWASALDAAGGDAAARAAVTQQILDALTSGTATNDDQKTLANKAEAGKYFAASTSGSNVALAKTVIDQVTSNADSVTGAKQVVDAGGVVAPAPAPTPAPVPPASTFFTPNAGTTGGSSDASTAIALANNFMLVGDDEASVLRVYSRDGGAAVKEISYDSFLNLGGEADLEGSTRIGNKLYFIGSHGNSKSGNEADSREWITSATLTDAGADTALTFDGKYTSLETALKTWDSNNVHGKGANYFGITVGATTGSPERTGGLGIEGLTVSPDDSSLWIGFRAPVTGSATQKALIVQISNIDAVLAGSNAVAPAFGAAIELDLGGRGIRSIEKNAAGQYVIIAGPSGTASADVADDFRLYTWDGSVSGGQATNLVQNAVNLDAILSATGGSFESIVTVPDSLAAGSWIQLLQDNGDTIWPGETQVSKDLANAQQKFMGNWIQLGGAAAADTTGPLLVRSTPADNALTIATGSKIELVFNEPVHAGTGSYVLKSGSTTLATIAANDSRITYEYNKVTVDVSTFVSAANTAYSLEIASNTVLDASNNAFAGLTPAQAIDFTTAPLVGTSLAAGDIAFVGINTAGTDAYAFVLLKDIDTGTSIRFTDKGWDGTAFKSGESDLLWTANSALTAGTIVTIQPSGSGTASTGTLTGGGGGLGGSGEQVFAITGTVASPGTYLAAIGIGPTSGGLSNGGTGPDFDISAIPAGVTLGTNGVNIIGSNAHYTGTLTGTPSQLLSAIHNSANWTTGTPAAVTANQLNVGFTSVDVKGPTKLAAGEVIFLAMGTDSPDAFVFTVTKAIEAGTQIGFTDRDYSTLNGMPASGESAYIWTANQAYAAGTLITIQPDQSGANNPIVSHGSAVGKGGGLSASGETIYAFQGSIAGLSAGNAGAISASTYLGAINAGGAAAGDTPAGITIQTFAMDNALYTGSRDAADMTAFKAAVLNTANWSTSDTTALVIAVGGNVEFAPA